MLNKEVIAKFDKTTERYALYRHSPSPEEDLIVQVYVPRKSLNGNIPQTVKVSIQQI